MTLTAIILTHNNQNQIRQLIASLSWCDEIIIIDDQSTDRTRIIAKKLGAKVFIRLLRHNFAAQRNFGLSHVATDWAFFVDPDETVSSALAREIKSSIKSRLNGFFINRTDYFLGKQLQHGETGHVRLLRLAKTHTGRWHRPVHEIWRVKAPVGQLRSPLFHQPHPNLASFLDKINYYTTLEAHHRPLPERRRLLFELVCYPPAKFVFNYIFRFGFLDGLPGLVSALMMSIHSLLVRLKLYEKSLAQPAHHSNRR